MKKNIISLLLLSSIIAFYGFLYLACSVDKCDDTCYKLIDVSDQIQKDSVRIAYAYQCGAGSFCIMVKDSISQNWNGLADTACLYIKNKGLQNYTVQIIGNNTRDTLVKQTCP